MSAVDDARRVAAEIGIPYYVMNFKDDFQAYVIDYFVEEYTNGQNAESMYCMQPLCEMGISS